MGTPDESMRIGELAARVGVSTHVLRAWESRYGLLSPIRTAAGYRLYGATDERRVRAVLAARENGAPAAEACARVLTQDRLRHPDPAAPVVAESTELVAELHRAVEAFDEVGTQSLVDRAGASLPFDRVINDVLMPYLEQLGDRWAAGELTVAHEHFASQLIRRRLAGLTSTWGVGTGPVAVLACPPGELHDIALLAYGLLLGRAGWRVRYLGPDTPLTSLAVACRIIDADLVVVAASRERVLAAYAGGLRTIAQNHPLALGGRGATPEIAEDIGADLLSPDLAEAVHQALDIVVRADRPLPRPSGDHPS